MRTRVGFTSIAIALTLSACGRQAVVETESAARTMAGRPSPSVQCDGKVLDGESIQAEVNACGAVEILVYPGTYRETITPKAGQKIRGVTEGASRPIIKGSNVIAARNWVREQTYWTIAHTPKTETDDRRWSKCQDNNNKICLLRDQVFVTNASGKTTTLNQKATLGEVKTADDFWVGNRKLYIMVDPTTTSQIEVTARDRWVDGTASPSDVEISNLVMMHATNPSQSGAIQANGPRWTISKNDLS